MDLWAHSLTSEFSGEDCLWNVRQRNANSMLVSFSSESKRVITFCLGMSLL